jgi:hypothetical protein
MPKNYADYRAKGHKLPRYQQATKNKTRRQPPRNEFLGNERRDATNEKHDRSLFPLRR